MRCRLLIPVALVLVAGCLVPEIDWTSFEIACKRSSDCPYPQTCQEETCALARDGEGEGEGAAEGEGEGGGEGEGPAQREGPAEGEGEGPAEGEGEGPAEGEGEGEVGQCVTCEGDGGCDGGRFCVLMAPGRPGICRKTCGSSRDCPDDHACLSVAQGVQACLPKVGQAEGSWSCPISEGGTPVACRSGLTIELYGQEVAFSTHAAVLTRAQETEMLVVQWETLVDGERWLFATYVSAGTLTAREYAVPFSAAIAVSAHDGQLQPLAAGGEGVVEVTRAGRVPGEQSAGVIRDVVLVAVGVPESRCEPGTERCLDGSLTVCEPCGLGWRAAGPC